MKGNMGNKFAHGLTGNRGNTTKAKAMKKCSVMLEVVKKIEEREVIVKKIAKKLKERKGIAKEIVKKLKGYNVVVKKVGYIVIAKNE